MHPRLAFEEYTAEHLEAALAKRCGSQVRPVRFTVTFADQPADSVWIEFQAGLNVAVQAPRTFPNAERRDFFTNRWLSAIPLFQRAKYIDPATTGACQLWLDDFPGGPGLAFCGNAASHLLIPDSAFMETGGYMEAERATVRLWKPWRERRRLVFWRGSSTGNRHLVRAASWKDIPRFRLCRKVRELQRNDLFDIGLSHIVQVWDKAELEEIGQADLVRPAAPPHTFMDYQYSIDIDGNTCSWPGLFTKFVMGNTVLKIDSGMGFRQWYYDKLIPWTNFVPVSENLGELESVVEWLLHNEDVASDIARRGKDLAASLNYQAAVEDAAQKICAYIGRRKALPFLGQ